ncbi:U2-type spliceosomal complex subunit CWC21 [Aspergillus lucknowensis]|uniref:CWF21 domain-containing protein n=1 Tax=Aspergillus lucknowensis TaxID=176173 RepID=A0ABR4M411_9EURO
MSSNVGLSTPRGSGTSGYVQKNHAFLKPRNFGSGAPYPPPSSRDDNGFGGGAFKQRQPDQKILEHEMKREIEVKVLEERDRLEEENENIEEGKREGTVLSEDEIEERCERLRERLLREMEEGRENGRGVRDVKKGGRGFKAYQVHEAAEAKIRESERLRRALGIREEGGSFGPGPKRSARGEVERRREREMERERERD